MPPGLMTGEALAVNERCDAVGYGAGTEGRRALLWEPDGTGRDLNALLPPGTGWELEEARAINSHGWITGVGRLRGQRRGFILAPIPRDSFAVTPSTIPSRADRRAVGSILLDRPAGEDITFDLSSDAPGISEPLRKQVTIRRGEQAAFFFISINGVEASREVRFTARGPGEPRRAVMTLAP